MAQWTPTVVTNDPVCPYCEEEDRQRPKPNACKGHRWAYRYWFERARAGLKSQVVASPRTK